ncbi:MAG: hypothetical protein JW867_04195 [Candidatus Omnitrophica bacterium]|nr:hypothetical protein [Candidatus Omnitrophota bacterium]
MEYRLWTNQAYGQESPPLSYYEIIEKRNFFKPAYEPPASEKTPESDKDLSEKYSSQNQDSSTSDLTLTGIIKLKGRYKAIIEKKSTGEGFYLGVNDAVESYTIKDIIRDKVTLDKDGQEIYLGLKEISKEAEPESGEKKDLTPDQPQTATDEASSDLPPDLNTLQNLRSGSIKKQKNVDDFIQ